MLLKFQTSSRQNVKIKYFFQYYSFHLAVVRRTAVKFFCDVDDISYVMKQHRRARATTVLIGRLVVQRVAVYSKTSVCDKVAALKIQQPRQSGHAAVTFSDLSTVVALRGEVDVFNGVCLFVILSVCLSTQ